MKFMGKKNRNVAVRIENRLGCGGFDIYLDFSGQREYLMNHRHNGLLYAVLKDGPMIDDMRRWKTADIAAKIRRSPRSPRSRKATGMVNYLMQVIDDYMAVREKGGGYAGCNRYPKRPGRVPEVR